MTITQGVALGALVEAWRSPRPSNAVEKTAGAFAQHETPGSGGGDPIRTEVFTSPAGWGRAGISYTPTFVGRTVTPTTVVGPDWWPGGLLLLQSSYQGLRLELQWP